MPHADIENRQLVDRLMSLTESSFMNVATNNLLRVAVLEKFPPFIETTEGRPQGAFIDALEAAAQRAKLAVIFEPVSLNLWQKTLDEGLADALYPMAVTPKLLKAYDFSEPILSSGGGLFVRAPENTPDGLDVLAGKIVVTPRSGPLASYIAETAPAVRLMITEGYEESLTDLVSGAADAAALNLEVGAHLAEQLHPGKITSADRYFWELPLALLMSKGRDAKPAILEALNRGIRDMRTDGTMKLIMSSVMPSC